MKINIKQTSDFPQPKTDEPKTDEPKTDEPKTDEPKTDEPKTDEPKQAKTEVTAPDNRLDVTCQLLKNGIKGLPARWRKWNMARLQSQYRK